MLRLRSTRESPPEGWKVGSPLVNEPFQDWCFSNVCNKVKLHHPEWSDQQVQEQVQNENAIRCLKINALNFVLLDYPADFQSVAAKLINSGSNPQVTAGVNHFEKISQKPGLLLVLPFCPREVPALLKLFRWMKELDGNSKLDVLLSHDLSVDAEQVLNVELAATQFASAWARLCYPVPPAGYFAPNWAFQCTARFVSASLKRPWLWFESDMVPLKTGWFNTLETVYINSGKSCMGPVVEGMGHMNGTAIYSADYANWAKNAMRAVQSAWDVEQSQDTIGRTFNASSLMQHVWGFVDGAPHPTRGQPMTFQSTEQMRWIKPDAVTFHRCKDGSLIDRLREQKR